MTTPAPTIDPRTATIVSQSVAASDMLAGIVSHFGKVARITSGTDAQVKLENNGSVVAWTTMQSDISLNSPLITQAIDNSFSSNDPSRVESMLETVIGAINHELCHLLYSPKLDSLVVKTLQEFECDTSNDISLRRLISNAWNILEDQRIESLYVAKFDVFSLYFTKMVAQWVITQSEQTDAANSWLLVVERRYLPSKMRDSIHTSFVNKWGQDLCDEVEEVAAAYKRLLFTGRQTKDLAQETLDLLVRYAKVMVTLNTTSNSSTYHKHFASAGRDVSTNRSDMEKNAQQSMFEDDESDPEDLDESDDELDGSYASGESDDDQDGDDENKSDSTARGTDAGSDDKGTASSSSKSNPSEIADVDDQQKAAQDALDSIDQSDILKDHIQTIVEDIRANHSVGKMSDRLPISNMRKELPQWEADPAKLVVKRLVNHFLKLRNELEPTNEPNNRTGRLNMRSAIRRMVFDESDINVFNKFTPSREDEVAMDIAVLVDMSSSMDYMASTASAAAWAIKMAAHKLQLPCAVISFSSDSSLVWDYADTPTPTPVSLFTGGATNPINGLTASLSYFRRPNSNPVQVCFIITDGQWTDKKADTHVYMLNNMGVHTCLIGLSNAFRFYGSHGCIQGQDCNDVSDLSTLMEQTIRELVRNSVMHGDE